MTRRCGRQDLAPLGPHPGSVGRPRSDAAIDAARRTAPHVRRDPARTPDLVVLTDSPVVDPATADTLLGQGIPHLPSPLLETTATVGPLVTPGEGPCLRCLDLHRCDRDPGLAGRGCPAQPRRRDGSRTRLRSATDACDVVLATCAASLAALMALAWLGAPARAARTSGDGIDGRARDGVRPPAPRPAARDRATYSPHPRCGCSWGGRQ